MDLLGVVRNLLTSGPRAGSGMEPPPEEAVRALSAFLREHEAANDAWYSRGPGLGELPAGQAVLGMEPSGQVGVVHAVLERILSVKSRLGGEESGEEYRTLNTSYLVLDRLLARKLPVDGGALSLILERTARIAEASRDRVSSGAFPYGFPISRIVSLAERVAGEAGLPDQALPQLRRIRPDEKHEYQEERKVRARIDALFGVQGSVLPEAGEPWADTLRTDLSSASKDERAAWEALLAHARTADGARPTVKWLKEAARLLACVGDERFLRRLQDWLPRVAERRSVALAWSDPRWTPDPNLLLSDHNADLLKGLAWICAELDKPSLPALLGDLAESCYKKLPWHGPRCAKVANACVQALGLSPRGEAAAQLSRLKTKVEAPSARGLIEKALDTAAARAGLTAADLEELALPSFGLDAEGKFRSQLGRFTAEVRLDGARDAKLCWFTEEGKEQKTVPAEVKRDHAEDLKALQQTVKELKKLLPAQRDRLERLLLSERGWSYTDWKERYLEHPLVAPLTRRLIWHFQDEERSALAIPDQGTPTDVEGRPLSWLTADTRVRLWHPVGIAPEIVLAWRVWLENQSVTQPFKQAHREIYLLTDAELNTRTYSNRFAAHVLKQHQFKALCDQRGWTYRLQGGFDSGGPMAVRTLPEWDLCGEFWVEGAPGDEVSMSEAGISLYVATDQVRFLRQGETIPLIDVPTLVFSEVMRDVDLFVGVSSVGNDPAWMDRGEAPFQDYWHSYSFGDLSNTAETGREILTRLLPRLKIRDRCSLDRRFLRVRGSLRTYKIHLGSSNILMDPNDQYLCIVPDRTGKAREEVFLPFEGDRTLSVILSKAFMLADDTKIKDPSIIHQIKR